MAGEVWRLMEENNEVYRSDDLADVREFLAQKTGDMDGDEEGWL